AEHLELRAIRVVADDVVSDLGERGTGNQTYMSATDDGNLHDSSSFANHSAVRRRPSSSEIVGSQSSTRFASEMSGRRTAGSSAGRGANSMEDVLAVISMMSFARSRTEISDGLPRLTGPT